MNLWITRTIITSELLIDVSSKILKNIRKFHILSLITLTDAWKLSLTAIDFFVISSDIKILTLVITVAIGKVERRGLKNTSEWNTCRRSVSFVRSAVSQSLRSTRWRTTLSQDMKLIRSSNAINARSLSATLPSTATIKVFTQTSRWVDCKALETNLNFPFVQSFACQSCTKTFKSLRNLKRHQMFHEPSKIKYKYLCDYESCGKRFYTNYAKTRHMLTHSGIVSWIFGG